MMADTTVSQVRLPGSRPTRRLPTLRRRFSESFLQTVRAGGTVAIVATFLAISVNGIVIENAAPPPPIRLTGVAAAPPDPAGFPIRHIVVLMMENQAYDDYFGVYCRSLGPFCDFVGNGLPLDRCLPHLSGDPASGCTKPFPYTPADVTVAPDMPHLFLSSEQAYDNGAMDGFYLSANDNPVTYGYYTGSELPTYWDLAERYALGDYFFSSTLSYSLPNHWYLLAGQAPPISEFWTGPSQVRGTLTPDARAYLNESNQTRTIEESLATRPAVSWEYYDWPLSSYSTALGASGPGVAGGADAFDYWNPMAARYTSYANFSAHFQSRGAFFADAAEGALPNVAWIIPAFNQSDHAPADLNFGMDFVRSVADAVETSPDWSSTALFVTWDDYGGHYDHVAPPQMYRYGLSFREPLLVISPYTPQGYIDDNLGDFQSTLRLIEWRFGLPSVSRTDAIAPLPLEYFDAAAAPRPPASLASPAPAYPALWQRLPAPGPPTQLIVRPLDPTSVGLNWTAPVGGQPFAGYALSWSPVGGAVQGRQEIPRNWAGAIVQGLLPGVDYAFQLRAFAADLLSVSATAVYSSPPSTGSFPLQFDWLGRFDL